MARNGTHHSAAALQRQVGVGGATMMGLGSILGTGIFVSLAVAAERAGPSVILAIAVAALVATCNGLSSAQLAAASPVSGGTYEYGYRWLHPRLGFTAGWMFLCAKSASAATAALGFAGYLTRLVPGEMPIGVLPLALAVVVVLTGLVVSGMRRTNRVNIVIVSVSIAALVAFVLGGLPEAWRQREEHLRPFFQPAGAVTPPWTGFLEACALMFVAYTGYGRIATLGEEIVSPRRNIPRAIVTTLLVSMGLYIAVAWVGIAAVGAEQFSREARESGAPLEGAARHFAVPGIAELVGLGAVTAMAGVLLNLILGLSRVLLAMGRRRDVPAWLGQLDATGSTPVYAVLAVGVGIAGFVLMGDVKLTWSFSAFTVLIYYAITNLAAVRMSAAERLYPVWIPWLGLVACLGLAFWVERRIWLFGVGLIAAGLIWQQVAMRWRRQGEQA